MRILKTRTPPDTKDLGKLETSVNATSQRAVAQWIAYLSLWGYLFFTTLSVTDRDLILLTPVKLPLIGVELGLQAFFWAGPPLFWVFHLYLVRKVAVLARDLAFYRDQIVRQVRFEAAREPLYRRLDAFFLTRLLGHDTQSNALRALDGMIAVVTVILLPMVLMLAFQVRFLAFHDEAATNWHRGWLLADVGLIGFVLWRADHIQGLFRRKFWRADAGRLLWIFARHSVLGAYVFFSVFIATFPEDTMDRIMTDRGIGARSLPWFPLRRNLQPSDTDFVNDEKLNSVEWTLDLRHRDFRGAQLSGADLRKARLEGADLRGADLSEAQLQGANISNSNLESVNFEKSNMEGINISRSSLKDSNIVQSELRGSDLSLSQMQNADFSLSNMQGAEISNSQLQGSRFYMSKLQGASFFKSQMQGANFYMSDLQGVDFSQSELQGSDFSRSNLQGANLFKADLRGVNVYKSQFYRTRAMYDDKKFDESGESLYNFHNYGLFSVFYTFHSGISLLKEQMDSLKSDLGEKVVESPLVDIALANGTELRSDLLERVVSLDLIENRKSVSFSGGMKGIEAMVPAWVNAMAAGPGRQAMERRLAGLLEKRSAESDAADERLWRSAFGQEPPNFREKLTNFLAELVCRDHGHAVHGIVRRATIASVAQDSSIDAVDLAKRILDPGCDGEKRLKDWERAYLEGIVHAGETVPPS